MSIPVLYEPELADIPEIMPVTRFPLSEIFEIKFYYPGDAFRAKALKICYRDEQSIFKVMLGSSVSHTLRICWLQRQPQGWVVLLGQGREEKLKPVITAAIERNGY